MADSIDKTMWRSKSAKLTIETIQGFTNNHISKYVFDVYNGNNTLVNTSFSNAGEGGANGRAISTSEHVASKNTTGYTDYTVKGYLKYTHTSYGSTTTVATSNVVEKSLRVKEPLDTESLTGFTISPTTVWSNVAEAQNITITPSFAYTPFSKFADITCSQSVNAVGGGSNGAASLELNGTSSVQYQNNNVNKDLRAKSINIEFYAYSITDKSADIRAVLHSTTLTVKNAVTGLSIPASLHAYNNATSWDNTKSVRYTPEIPYSKNVSLVHADSTDAYSENTISQNGVSVTLNPSTGVLTFDVSKAKDPKLDTTFKFRVKSVETQGSVYSNPMTLTVHGYTPSYNFKVIEGETYTIANLGIGEFDLPTGLKDITVNKTGNNLGIEIKANAVSADVTKEFTITSTTGSQVNITCAVQNLKDLDYSINTGDTITITGQKISESVGTTITGVSAITTGPGSGNGTAYVSSDGKLVYYAPATAVENVPITVTTNTGASVIINIKVKAITMSIV